MQHVQHKVADPHLIAFLEPAIGLHIARTRTARTRAQNLDHMIEQKLVGAVRPLDGDAELFLEVGRRADMVDMPMGYQNAFDLHLGFGDRALDIRKVAARIDDRAPVVRLVPDERAILLKRRYRDNGRASPDRRAP